MLLETNEVNVWSEQDAADFRAMYQRLRRFAGVVGPWELEPEDLLQEALARTLRNGPLSRLASPEAYLRQAMVNISTNHFRRRGQRLRSALAARGEDASTPEYPSDLADLLSLDPTARAVVYLHDVEGYSFEEIGEALDLPASSCRQVASRARSTLRRGLEGEVEP